MRKPLLVSIALALVVAACGGDGDTGITAATTAPTTMAATATTEAPIGGTTATDAPSGGAADDPSTTASTAASGPEGDPAPDFTLGLADGSSFTLSAEQKPVYMIFWAEW